MQGCAISVDNGILGASVAAGFPSTAASPFVLAIHGGYHLLLTGTSRCIDTTTFTTVDLTATAAAAQVVHINVVHESTKSQDTSKRNKGASRQSCRPMCGKIGLLPFGILAKIDDYVVHHDA